MVPVRAVLVALLLACAPLAQADTPSGGDMADDAPSGGGDMADDAPSGSDMADDAPAGQGTDPQDEPAVGPSAAPGSGGGRGGRGSGDEDGQGGDSGGDKPAAWPKCPFESGNDTHTLLGIMSGRFTDRFGESTFSNLLQRVDASTLRILKDFNVSSDGYTLIVPTNRATNFSDPDLDIEPIFSLYGIDPVFISAENATLIVRNHIIPETLTYFKLEQLTEAGMPARYASLGDAVWEFTFFTTEGAVDGTVVLMDTYNVTQERADDILFMQWDISNAKQGDCPNNILTVDGLLATEEVVNPPAPQMAPAPAPMVAPPPLPPREIVSTSANFSAVASDGPAPVALPPSGLVDEDRLEALAANQPSSSPPGAQWGMAVMVPPLIAAAALLCAHV